jgi:hypothetical protein
MIQCRDLALNNRWVMELLRAQRHGAHISVITPTLLGIAHIGVRDIIIYQQKFVINKYKKFLLT